MNPFEASSEFSGQTFKNLALPGESITGREFDGCTFSRCDFREAKFADCRFRDCTFTACELNALALTDSTLSEVAFDDCRLIAVNFAETTWARNRFLLPARFNNCALNYALFVGLDIHEGVITGCSAREADFSEANLTKADCTKTDFQNARFWQTNLTEADFRGATNYAIAAGLNTLKQTRFSLPDAMSLLYSLDIILDDES